MIRSNVHPDREQALLFLQKLQILYSEPNKDETIAQTKKELAQTFKTGKDATEILYHQFFYYFMEWLGNEQPIRITNVQIMAMFTEWHNRLLQLQQWIGISSAYQSKLVTTINNHTIPRDRVIPPFLTDAKSRN